MLRGVTTKHRVHDDVLASHGRSSGRRNPWASDTRASVHRTPVAGCPARVADGRAGRAAEEACEARRPGRAAQRPDRAGERGGRPSGRHGPGGRSVRTAHGPGGVAGRADGAGGPGGLPAGPGRASVPPGRWHVQRRDSQAESARGRVGHACPFFRPAQAMGVRPVRVRPTDASITLRVVRGFQQRGCSPVKTL